MMRGGVEKTSLEEAKTPNPTISALLSKLRGSPRTDLVLTKDP